MLIKPSRLTILKFSAIVAIILGVSFGGTFAIAGCGAGGSAASRANGDCAEHHGVQEIESNMRVVVCKDGYVVEE